MRILFLCVANSARSQLGEALAKALYIESVIVESAGSQPSGKVHPAAMLALATHGIQTNGARSKAIEDIDPHFISHLDYVVTLCAEEICPVMISQAQKIHWPIPDPAAAPERDWPQAFNAALETIRDHLHRFGIEHQILLKS